MTKKFAILALTLVLAACAQKQAAPPASNTVPLPPPPPRGEPNNFTNLPAAKLRAMLGSPAFIRKDGATEMWRYDAKNCHAYFFLYGAGTAQKVQHAETLPQGRGEAADPACLSALTNTPQPSLFPQ